MAIIGSAAIRQLQQACATGRNNLIEQMARECMHYYDNKSCRKHTSGVCDGCNLDITDIVGPVEARLTKYKIYHKYKTEKERVVSMLMAAIVLFIGAVIAVTMLSGCWSNDWVNTGPSYIEHYNAFLGENKIWYEHTGDGIINCQDIAIQYYMEHGGKAAGYVLIGNVNPNTGMNHLFVYNRNTGVHIEPKFDIPMGTVWGNKYDPRYNENCMQMYAEYLYGK